MILKKAEPAPVFNAFDKDTFKKNVIANIKTLYRKTLEEASQQQIFQAVAHTVKDVVIEDRKSVV